MPYCAVICCSLSQIWKLTCQIRKKHYGLFVTREQRTNFIVHCQLVEAQCNVNILCWSFKQYICCQEDRITFIVVDQPGKQVKKRQLLLYVICLTTIMQRCSLICTIHLSMQCTYALRISALSTEKHIELLWFLNASALWSYHLQLIMEYLGVKEFHKLTCGSILLQFHAQMSSVRSLVQSIPLQMLVKADWVARQLILSTCGTASENSSIQRWLWYLCPYSVFGNMIHFKLLKKAKDKQLKASLDFALKEDQGLTY